MIRASLTLVSLAAAASAQVSMTLVGTIDVASATLASNPQYVGTNPSCIAWNGTDLFVAGYNNTAAAGITAIAKCSTALTTPTWGTAFGAQPSTPSLRGYTGLDVDGTQLVAAFDPGVADPNGLTSWTLAGTSIWAKNNRGSCGVGLDPGHFTLVDQGTGYINFGSGRRSLINSANGTDIYTPANGMIVQVTGETNTFWRDMAFDPLIGDIYLRRSNDVVACDRTGGNSVANARVLADAPAADFINMQNLAVVRTNTDTVVFWNLRNNASVGQAFTNVIQCTRTVDSASMTIDWGTFVAANSAGAYDFSYDETSGTLAISDFVNKLVHVFAVSVFKPYGTACVGNGNFPLLLGASGDLRPGGALTYTITQADSFSIAGFAFGAFQDFTLLPNPPFLGNCFVHVTPVLFTEGVFFTGVLAPGSGTGSLTFTVPPGLAGQGITAQGFCLQGGILDDLRTSNGIEIIFP